MQGMVILNEKKKGNLSKKACLGAGRLNGFLSSFSTPKSIFPDCIINHDAHWLLSPEIIFEKMVN